MAILKNGKLHGRVGNLIYCMRNGVSYVRVVGKPSNKRPTQAQLAQRERFRMANQFLRPLAAILNWSFDPQSPKKSSGLNKAVRYLLQEAFVGVYPALLIDPARVMVSAGSGMVVPEITDFSLDATGKLVVGWETGNVFLFDDHAFVLVYNESLRQVWLSGGNTFRSDGGLDAQLDPGLCRGILHAYAFMKKRNKKVVSHSVYLGTEVFESVE